jgi:hypothetical protein
MRRGCRSTPSKGGHKHKKTKEKRKGSARELFH